MSRFASLLGWHCCEYLGRSSFRADFVIFPSVLSLHLYLGPALRVSRVRKSDVFLFICVMVAIVVYCFERVICP